MKIGDLRLGKIDGKHEYLEPSTTEEQFAFDSFLIPQNIDVSQLDNRQKMFVEGFRGTGKTSLLRWHAEQMRRNAHRTEFVLFKTELTEEQKLQISKEAGISWTDINSSKMEISQDFKSVWSWFILHKIGEIMQQNTTQYSEKSDFLDRFFAILGLDQEGIFQKVLGFLPRIEGASIKIKSKIDFFEAELTGDFQRDTGGGKTTLEALNRKAFDHLRKINFKKKIYLYFDELEVFYHNPEQYKRDQRMTRDLLFCVYKYNDLFRKEKIPIFIVAAVRSEIIDSMGSIGQEIDRVVHDHGLLISWHHAKKSLSHPLFEMIA
ncbi:MAG: P-loop ATPase, Sll1717 family, partial [Flammeovirgaceae bacterium]